MKIQLAQIKGRKGWNLDNDILSLFVMAGGGHIAALHLKGLEHVNPFWTPNWKTCEPWQYHKKDAARYGGKLLSCISGHNLCLGAFGDPSAEEARAGLDCHAEAPVSRWHCIKKRTTSKQVTFSYGCDLPVAQMKFARTIILRANSSVARISERVTNMARRDVPFTMCQHVTFGPPFLESGVTAFDLSATRGQTFPGIFGKPQRLKSSTAFTWPKGPGKRGNVDLRFMGKGKNSDFTTNLMNPRLEHAWFSAVNPRLGMMIAYIWQRSDYPWTGIWEERFVRKDKPWNGKAFTRGMEFSNTPFPVGLRKAVNMGTLHGQPTFRWLPALSTLTYNYSLLAVPVESNCKGVCSIKPYKKGFDIDLMV